MKKLMRIFMNIILVLSLLFMVQSNKAFAAGTFGTAVELKENIAVEERIEAGEEDFYYFITQESGLYEIETISEIDTYGDLYNENCSEIINSDDDEGEGANFKISMELEANKKYYIKVRGFHGGIEGDYKIVFKKIKVTSILGKISLPSGQVAPSGGIDVILQPMKLTYEDNLIMEESKIVHIEEGQNIAEYIIPTTCDETGGKYKIAYYVSNQDYASEGFYNTTGTVLDISLASIIQINAVDVSEINIALIPIRKITGKISLPNGEVAPTGGMDIFIHSIKLTNENRVQSEAVNIVNIETGQNSAEYSTPVVSDSTGGRYIVGYDRYSNGNEIEGYYNENGTTVDKDLASIIEVNGIDVTGIDIGVLLTRKITGKISLPNGEVAPTGGIYFYIHKMRKVNEFSYIYDDSKEIYIEAGQNSAEYNFPVVCTGNVEEYKIEYKILNNESNYVKSGYYGVSETVLDENFAGIIKVLDKDVTDINIEVIKGILISGKINLPEGKVADAYGMGIDIIVSNKENNMNFTTNVYLGEGENEVNYSIALPMQNEAVNYIVAYNYYDTSTGVYVRNGYYNSIKTTTMEEKATLIEALSSSIENINMTIIPGKIIKGTIDIPDNIDLPFPWMEVKIVAIDEPNDVKVDTSIGLQDHARNVDYYIVVPSDANLSYKVSYELPERYYGNSLKRGFYSNNGTVANSKDASLISIIGEEIASINMTLLRIEDIPDDYSDNLQNAALIENNSINHGIINHLGDKDYFKFEISQTSLIKLYATGNFKIKGELFNSNGENIITGNESFLNSNLEIVQVLEPGTYFIEVSSDSLGIYNLNIETTINSSENQYKISMADHGQIPTIETIYFEGQRGGFEFDFRTALLNDISKVGNEYVVTLMGFDWNRADKYYVWINDGTYLLKQVLTSVDKGKTIILMPDDTYTNTNIDIENAGENLQVQNFSLHQNWLNGETIFISNINSDMYIPMGEYGIQINASNETSGYTLLKNKVNISKENNLIYFKADELAKLDINMKDYTGSELKFSSLCAAYFNVTYSLSSYSSINNIYVSKADYNVVWFSFETKDNWEYQYPLSDDNITGDRILNFDTELSCKINLENTHFEPNEGRGMKNQLQITDSFNNSLDYIINIIPQEFKNIEGKIRLENATEKYDLVISSLSYPYIVLPNTNGTFNMTFYVDEGPIKIKSATTIITIGDPNASSLKNYDLNFDGTVNISDIEALGQGYGTENGDSSYDVNEDLNGDGVIDIFDLVILSKKIK